MRHCAEREDGQRQATGNRSRLGIAIAGAFWLLGSACAGEHSNALLRALAPPRAAGPCGTSYLADVADGFRLAADTATPGAAPAVVFEMFIPGSSPASRILLTRRVVVTLPAEFGFEGFGAPGAAAGSWDFDFSRPGDGAFDPLFGEYDYRIPHRATGPDGAYADTLLNGAFDAGIDSTATHALGVGGEHVFTIELPSGGTNNNGAGGNCSYFDTDTRFTLPQGVVRLPPTAGIYDVTVIATSVDPDTGDADDRQGASPVVYQRTIPVAVPEPGAALAGLTAIAAAALRRSRAR